MLRVLLRPCVSEGCSGAVSVRTPSVRAFAHARRAGLLNVGTAVADGGVSLVAGK